MKYQVKITQAVLVAYGLLIGYLSLQQLTGEMPANDKLMHFLAYGLFAVIGCFARGKPRLWLMLAIVGYGGVLELVQGTLPYREASLADFLANSLGVVLGVMGFQLLKRIVGNRFPGKL